MQFKAIIFDFDGTLVLSNQLKIDAYYTIFKLLEINQNIISSVITQFPELNRFTTIDKIINLSKKKLDHSKIYESYNQLVFKNILSANSLQYAEDILDYLSVHNIMLHLSSNTPQPILYQIINNKGWVKYFKTINGYPNTKNQTVNTILCFSEISRQELLIVGDGDSDMESARSNEVAFFKVYGNSLKPLIEFLKLTPLLIIWNNNKTNK